MLLKNCNLLKTLNFGLLSSLFPASCPPWSWDVKANIDVQRSASFKKILLLLLFFDASIIDSLGRKKSNSVSKDEQDIEGRKEGT